MHHISGAQSLVYLSTAMKSLKSVKFYNCTDCRSVANYLHVVQFWQWPTALLPESPACNVRCKVADTACWTLRQQCQGAHGM